MATRTQRIQDEPAFVLHRYDWSESSLILDVFTRHHGRTSLVAKGAKKPSSNFRPVLLPLQPLRLGYTLASGVHPLKGAEWVGGHVMPTGDALLAGLYLNELLLRLLAPGDAHTALFDTYAGVVRVLASEHGEALEPVLRAFELILLRELGLLPTLEADSSTLQPLQPQARYLLQPETGLCLAPAHARSALPGEAWCALQQALAQPQGYPAVLRACAPVSTALKPLLRALLQYHCGSPLLRTRQLMMDLQTL